MILGRDVIIGMATEILMNDTDDFDNDDWDLNDLDPDDEPEFEIIFIANGNAGFWYDEKVRRKSRVYR